MWAFIARFAFVSWLPNLPEGNLGNLMTNYVAAFNVSAGYDALVAAVFKDGAGNETMEFEKQDWRADRVKYFRDQESCTAFQR